VSERVLLVSSAPPSWSALTELTWATMAKYAKRHGYDFHADVSDVKAAARTPEWGKGYDGTYIPIRGFIKLDLLLHFLDPASCKREYDIVVWADADMLFCNYDIPISRWMTPDTNLLLPFDPNGHNATVIGCRNSVLVRDFLWASNNAGRTMFLRHDWEQMQAMRFFLETPPYAGMAKYVSVKEVCGMPPNVYPIPDVTRKQYEWEPGDLAVHFSALTLDLRVQMAKKWVVEYSLLP
jgi:hypothetical protein